MKISWLLAIVTLLGSNVLAQERPAPPEEVFRYAVFDTGTAIEVDWFIDDGAYMYRDAFGFSSGDSAVVFGDVEFPEAKMHYDEFLGEQAIYRGNALISIPYTVTGDRPDKLPVTIDSRGCLDSGFCYAPTRWIETVAMKSADTAAAPLDFSSLGSSGQDEFPEPDEVFFPNVYVVDGSRPEKRTVTTGRRSPDLVELVSGIEPGERISLVAPAESG